MRLPYQGPPSKGENVGISPPYKATVSRPILKRINTQRGIVLTYDIPNTTSIEVGCPINSVSRKCSIVRYLKQQKCIWYIDLSKDSPQYVNPVELSGTLFGPDLGPSGCMVRCPKAGTDLAEPLWRQEKGNLRTNLQLGSFS